MAADNYSSSIVFTIAIAFLCFQATDTLVRAVVGVAWFFVCMVVLWCIWSGLQWDMRELTWNTSTVAGWLRSRRSIVRRVP
jgi:amino acid permease